MLNLCQITSNFSSTKETLGGQTLQENADLNQYREHQEQIERIRDWYKQAKDMGISKEAFYREMIPIVGIEALDKALEGYDE